MYVRNVQNLFYFSFKIRKKRHILSIPDHKNVRYSILNAGEVGILEADFKCSMRIQTLEYLKRFHICALYFSSAYALSACIFPKQYVHCISIFMKTAIVYQIRES